MKHALLIPTIALSFVAPLVAAERPNVLLIAVDDMNNDLACYGHSMVKSPNIDRLAHLGVRFDRAYCQYPLCNPSRVSLLAGLRPDTTRVMDLETPPRTYLKDVVFLPQYFRRHGYHAAHVGKIFHTGPDFEDPRSWDVEVRETGKHPPESAVIRGKQLDRPRKYNMEWAELRSRDEETADGVVAHTACGMIEQLAAGKKPFFLAVGFRRPHQPYAAPKKYFDLYPPETIPRLDEPHDHLGRIPPMAFSYPPGTPPLDERDRQEVVAAYYACISFVDAQTGLVLETLDRLKLWRNTIVVFYSDHGYHLGEHGGMWHKMSLFEESARVPLVIVAPGAAGNGRSCSGLVELVDIYPTLVELCGLSKPGGLEGQSLCPLLDDPHREGKEAAYTQVRRENCLGRSVRTARWRYTEWDDGHQGIELYDHDADPREYVNLAGDPKWGDMQSQMRALLAASVEKVAGSR